MLGDARDRVWLSVSMFRPGLLALAVLTGLGLEAACAPWFGGILGREHFQTERVSVDLDGTGANDSSHHPAVSGDGRFVAFSSLASNLLPGDSNGWADVFVYDRQTGSIERVSVSSDGAEGNEVSYEPSLNADGRFIAFTSFASNLVNEDMNPGADVFVRDRLTGVTEIVSISSDGAQGDNASSEPSLSRDGRFVAFSSQASNLVPVDSNGLRDVFAHDRLTGVTVRVSVFSHGVEGSNNSQWPSISGDGWLVAFDSAAPNLVSGDTNRRTDVFVHDRRTGVTERVSVGDGGAEGTEASWGPCMSRDGRVVAFTSFARNLVAEDNNASRDAFVRDLEARVTQRVSVAFDGGKEDGGSTARSISSDGRFVVFSSLASNLVRVHSNPGTDVLLRDRTRGKTVVVSVASDGAHGDRIALDAAVGEDGRTVVFHSLASNMVPGDENLAWDIFVRAAGQR